MTRIKYFFVLCMVGYSALSFAQRTNDRELLIQSFENGARATRLEDLVNTSDVVVRGRYGKIESVERDYGGKTLESIMATGKTAAEAASYGISIASHSIIADEIIKGEDILFGSKSLTLRIAEPPGAVETYEWLAEFRKEEHLFFLEYHPDREVFSLQGPMFDMKKTDQSYYYLDEHQKYISVFGSEDSASFLSNIANIAK